LNIILHYFLEVDRELVLIHVVIPSHKKEHLVIGLNSHGLEDDDNGNVVNEDVVSQKYPPLFEEDIRL
jgi:hypothetical protein